MSFIYAHRGASAQPPENTIVEALLMDKKKTARHRGKL